MENDLISRSALLEKSELIIDENYDDYIVVYEEDIKNAPAVDAVEVVRCKDCKGITCYFGDVEYSCKRGYLPYVELDDFCPYGERREENAAD